jgi:hypothetical protein
MKTEIQHGGKSKLRVKMFVIILFVSGVLGFYIERLRLIAYPVQMEMQEIESCYRQSKIAGSQCRKRFSIWELGKNKFI